MSSRRAWLPLTERYSILWKSGMRWMFQCRRHVMTQALLARSVPKKRGLAEEAGSAITLNEIVRRVASLLCVPEGRSSEMRGFGALQGRLRSPATRGPAIREHFADGVSFKSLRPRPHDRCSLTAPASCDCQHFVGRSRQFLEQKEDLSNPFRKPSDPC